jgi:hypothetical protein
LCNLTTALRGHAEEEIHRRGADQFPFQLDTLRQTLSDLQAATRRSGAEQNFGEFISSKVSTPEVFECTVYFLYDLFARRLSLERQNRANRNFWYTVNRPSEAEIFRSGLFRLVDTYDVFFVSFNYDGLLVYCPANNLFNVGARWGIVMLHGQAECSGGGECG